MKVPFSVLFALFLAAGTAHAANKVFYSVGRNSTDDFKTAGTLTISGGTATFSTAQTNSQVGVGCELNYGSSKIAYCDSSCNRSASHDNSTFAKGSRYG